MRRARSVESYMRMLAKDYERNGFLVAAAGVYKNCSPASARRIYLQLGRAAETKALLVLAAEFYEAAGRHARARALLGRAARHLRSVGMDALAEDVERKLWRPSREERATVSAVRRATQRDRSGDFRAAKKAWKAAARRCEAMGELERAAHFYSNACLLKHAERAWKKRCMRPGRRLA